MRTTRMILAGAVLCMAGLGPVAWRSDPASAAGAVTVGSTEEFSDAFFDPAVSQITLSADVEVRDYTYRTLLATPLVIEGAGNTIELGPKGTLANFSYSNLTIHEATLTAPGATSPEVAGGRGVRWQQGVLTLDNVTVLDGVGTPVSISGGTLNVTDSTFEDNRATPITAYGLATVSVVRSAFSGNDAGNSTTGTGDGYGGAIYLDGTSALTVVDSAFSGNRANVSGGAIYGLGGEAPFGSAVTITGSSFAANSAPGGGAIVAAKVTLTNSTVTGNSATEGSGGVTASRLTASYSTIVDNAGPRGANVLAVADPARPAVPAQTDWYASVVGYPRGGGANCSKTPGAQVDTTSSYAVEGGGDTCAFTDATDRASVPDLGLLPGPTRAVRRDVRIPSPASILVDAIPIADCARPGQLGTAPLVDQRGFPRPQGNGCDPGAVERQSSDPSLPPPDPPITSTSALPSTAPDIPAVSSPAPAAAIPGTPRYTG